jgi:hypothetical protein
MQKVSRIAYLRLCYAGLQEDMAQRIMFSTLPYLANPAQVALTEGVVDVNALKAAVEGRKNIIKYGVIAVLGELEHYREAFTNTGVKGKKSEPYIRCRNAIVNNKFSAAMDIAIDAFKDSESWYTQYGGRPWEMIARAIRQIARLDYSLDELRSKPRSQENDKQEVQLMRDLIVEMNVFDGLAHNSDSILNNLAELEANALVPASKPMERKKRYKENYIQLKRLMDAKELNSPVEVFKLIQDTLIGSGDINKFKDWVTKMRSHQEFRQTDPKLTEKLFLIYMRKAFLTTRGEMNSGRDTLAKHIGKLEQKWDSQDFYAMLHDLQITINSVDILKSQLEIGEFQDEFIKQYQDLPTETVLKYLDPIKDKIVHIGDELYARVNRLESLQANEDQFMRAPYANDPAKNPDLISIPTKAINISKEVLSFLNQVSYILDAI